MSPVAHRSAATNAPGAGADPHIPDITAGALAKSSNITLGEHAASDKIRPSASLRERLRAFLFHSERLPDETWRPRHRTIVGIAAAHAPVIYLVATVVNHRSVLHGITDAGAIAVLATAALLPQFGRLVREAFATLAILTCSAMVVHVTGGSIEAHFHFFVVLAIVSLYQSWPTFLLAIAYVVVHHGLLGAISPRSVYNHPAAINNPWLWALIHAGFVLAASSVYVVMWRFSEAARNRARDLYRRLYEGQRSLVLQLQQAAQMKDELVSVVSHELRTPLTSIRGFGHLLADETAGNECQRKDWFERLIRQGERLQFLIDNLMRFKTQDPDGASTSDVEGGDRRRRVGPRRSTGR